MPKLMPHCGLSAELFFKIASEYCSDWHAFLCAVGIDGNIVFSHPPSTSDEGKVINAPCLLCTADPKECTIARRHVVSESVRWGEPTLYDSPEGHILWAVPLMHNAQCYGGLVACIDEDKVFPDDAGTIAIDLRRACRHLRELAETYNLTNSAQLEQNRNTSIREQRRAEAIHDLKTIDCPTIMERYLREEPELLSCIRRGERGEAVAILNRILILIYGQGAERLQLVKSLLMELVVSMCRTAVEAGADASELLGTNYQRLTEVAAIDNEESLSAWISATLNRIMDALSRPEIIPSSSSLQAGLTFMQHHYPEPISRDEAADAAHLSPAHFSRLLKEKTGHTFTDLLNRIRVDHASELLRRTDLGVMQIALDVGFSDQSYFTKVFRKQTQMTPKEYRARH